MQPFITDPSTVIILSVVISAAGVIVFAFAPRTANLYPPALLRGVGVVSLIVAALPVWVMTGLWWPPMLLAAVGLVAMIYIHYRQTASSLHEEQDESPEDPKPHRNEQRIKPKPFVFISRPRSKAEPPADDSPQ